MLPLPRRITSLAIPLAMAVFFATFPGHAGEISGYATVFAAPPFKLEETIIGMDGWEATSPQEAEVNALIVTDPPGIRGSALRLQRKAPEVIHLFRPLTNPLGGEVRVRARMTFHMPIKKHSSRSAVMVPRVGNVTFGVDYSASGGLYYEYRPPNEKQPEQVLVLPLEEINEAAEYELSAIFDLEGNQLRFTARGKRADGSALEYASEPVTYERTSATVGRTITGISLWSTAPARNIVYITALAVEPFSEP
jgi:hypothetical protein